MATDGRHPSGGQVRPKALFITPATPSPTAHGLAMRAHRTLEGLARHHDVTLVVVWVFGGAADAIEDATFRLASDVIQINADDTDGDTSALARLVGDPRWREAFAQLQPLPWLARRAVSTAGALGDCLKGRAFDVAVVMRSYLGPFLMLDAVERAGAAVIDLDDLEPETRVRNADLAASRGDLDRAAFERDEAERYARMERWVLAHVGSATVCSGVDADRVADRAGAATIGVLPNVVSIGSDDPVPASARDGSLLLVGSFLNPPNVDGARWLVDEIHPLLSRPRPPVTIAGHAPGAWAGALTRPGVEVVADPPDVAPLYRSCGAAVVPIRSGGGTRLKILEALSHAAPVVSTAMGAEGLDLTHGTDALIADSAAEFAQACAAVLSDNSLADHLATNGRSHLLARFTPGAAHAALDQAVRAGLRR